MAILFGIVVSTSGPQTPATYIPLQEWQAMQGDRFIADTQENMGYIVHEDGTYTSMRIGSGKKHVVRYIGKTYNATTPESFWTVKSLHIQGSKSIFGKTGRFMRLYDDGKTYTSYGIHATGNIDDILASDDRYMSMGCILVSDEVLDILYETYELNSKKLDVVTTFGIDSTLFAQNQ